MLDTINSTVGIVIAVGGVLLGAGVGYGALIGRIKSLEARQSANEVVTAKIETKLFELVDRTLSRVDAVAHQVTSLANVVTRIDERVQNLKRHGE